MMKEHQFLTGPEMLALRGSAKVCASLAADRLAESERMFAEANRLYWLAVDLDNAARTLLLSDLPTK
jgi:hypothetical protein